ncbi:PAS domain-containing protein [Thermodesulfobacteriota bacterium]
MSEKPTYEELEERIKALEEAAPKLKQKEAELKKSEEQYRLLVQNLPSIVYRGYKDWSVEFFDKKIEYFTGYHVEEFNSRRKKWSDIIVKEDIDTAKKIFIRSLKTNKSYVREYRIKSKAEKTHWIQERGQIVCDPQGNIEYVSGVFFDITDRKRTEAQIRNLTQQLMKAQENERRRIARELHDIAAQNLSLLKIGWDTLFDDLSAVPVNVRQKISELSRLLQGSITAVRNMAYDLRPPGLDQLGLVRTVYQYCEEFSDKNNIHIDFSAAGLDDLRIPFDTEINLYRLIQEALWNVKKHAEAKHVAVRLVASYPNIILRIEDDGRGFDARTVLVSASNEKRMGLRSMEERVRLLDGKIKVQSRPEEGTKILIEVPHWEKK